jgi:hypothetical protein
MITTAQDVSTNFFLHPDDIDSSIAESVVKCASPFLPSQGLMVDL